MSETKENIKELLDNLNSRTKELQCIYKIDEFLTDFSGDLEDILKKLVDVIPMGWRYPDICKVQILCNELEVSTEGFKNTQLKIISRIFAEDQQIGEVRLVYIQPIRMEKGIFLSSEVQLLKTIADKIGNFILYQKLRHSIIELEKQKEVEFKSLQEEEPVVAWLRKHDLRDDEIDLMTKIKIKFKKGENICKQGAIISYIMLATEGLSKNYLEGTQERGFNFKIVKPFDFIGLSSLFGNMVYHFSGAAIIPCTMFLIDKETFKEIIKTNPKFAEHIMGWYCKTTEGHLKRLSCIGNKQSLGRISEILLYLYDDVFKGELIENTISRKDIAELAGISTESAVRILSELKKDNIIKAHTKGIEILDAKLLKTLSLAG